MSSLPMTAAFFYQIISFFGVNIDLMSFCAIIPAILGTLTVLVLYFLGKDIGGKAVGMLAALFLALSPSVIQRTALGFFDTETVGLFSLVLFSFLFLRAVDEGRSFGSTVKYSLGSGLTLAYFIMGWGTAYYLIDLTVLFVFVLLLLRRYTRRLLLAYSITFGLGLLVSINNPYIAVGYLTSFAVLPVAGMFVLLCLSEMIRGLGSVRERVLFFGMIMLALVGSFATLWTLGYMHSIAGKFLTILDPFLRETNPLVQSVAEHRISSWSSVYFDLGIVIVFFVAGLFFVSRNLTNKNLFLLIFGLTSLYFASSMVRLLVILAPAFGLLAAVGVVGVLKPFATLLKEPPKLAIKRRFALEHVGKEYSGTAVFLIFIILMTSFAFSPQAGGEPRVYSQAYIPTTITSASLPLRPNEPVREWLDMLLYLNNFQNKDIVVCAWWDYGYWLTMLGNVTSLADNATIDEEKIQNIGFVFMANETQAVEMLDKTYKAKYVLVFTTLGLSSSSGTTLAAWVGYGDEGKWNWMAKISGGARDRFIREGYIDEESAWTDDTKFANFTGNSWVWYESEKNATIYKLLSWGKQLWCDENGVTPDEAGLEPVYFKPAYIAGLHLDPQTAYDRYGTAIVPLVCLYEVDYAKYYNYYRTP